MASSLVNDLSDLQPSTFEGHFKVTKSVCQIVRQIEKIPTTRGVTEHEMSMYSKCFCTCLGICSSIMLLARGPTSTHQDLQKKSSKALYGIFEDLHVLKSIIFQCRRDRNQTISPLESSRFLELLSLLATTQHAELFSLLTDSEIAPLLNEILRSSSVQEQQQQSTMSSLGDGNNSVPSNTIRGYSSTNSSQGVTVKAGRRVSWEVDIRHENSIKVYQFLAASVRAAVEFYSGSHKDKVIKRAFVDRALYCLHSHRRSVSECLNQVASAGRLLGHATAMGAQGLTIQLLREASSIMALVAAVTDKNEVDLFCQQYAKLFESLVRGSYEVILSITSFLGSAGIARELFQAMADLEQGNGGNGMFGASSSETRLKQSPVIDVFAGSGRNNVRHEAIQFSHFVSGCSSAVSAGEREDQSSYPDSWTPTSSSSSSPGGSGQGGELTESSLERNSKYAITNKFAFQIEIEAGLLLFHSTNVVWATHPANNSFVEFTPQEISQRRDISFLKNKDIIAYRTGGTRAMGEVEHVDTVNLRCYVRPMHEKENARSIGVPLHLIAGVEDRTKRRGMLVFSHAPETSNDLDRSRKELGIGHLLMGLRWCHEMGFELSRQQGGESNTAWIRMCAESLTLTMAKEASLHREHLRLRASIEQIRMVNAQLLDLFGTEEEFSKCYEFDPSSLMRRDGRMVTLLPEAFIGVIREELSEEIHSAIAYIREMKEIQKQQQSHHHHNYQSGGTSLMDASRWRHQGSF